jgi:hypothetical protein
VIHTTRGSVKLGIAAPTQVKVLRSELPDQIPEKQFTVDAAQPVNFEEGERPPVAEACVEFEVRPPRVLESRNDVYEEALPGRSIRRVLQNYRAMTTAK